MILHIETSTKVCSVALSIDGNMIAIKEDGSDGFTHAENLTVFIDELMSASGKKYSDLKAISVASGPGSYTGLRIGVSSAKGLCYALGIPLIAVDALLSLAYQMKGKTNVNLCPVIDARRMEVYSAIYSPDLSILKQISADVIQADSYQSFGKIMVAGDGAEKLKEIWAERKDVIFNDDVLASAKGQIQEAWRKYGQKDFENLAYFEPIYLKTITK